MESLVTGSGGSISGGSISRSRGSVMTPFSAVAPATSGSQVDVVIDRAERPWKFRLNVRTEGWPEGGACPMPTHGPHAGSSRRAPAAT